MSTSRTFRIYSLKTRIAVAVTLLFILFSFACGYLGERFLEQTIRETVHSGQFSYVTSLVQSLDDKFELVQNALVNTAAHLGPEIVISPEKSQDFLDTRFALNSFFDNALFLISPDGRIIAESPFLKGRRVLATESASSGSGGGSRNLSHGGWLCFCGPFLPSAANPGYLKNAEGKP